MATATSIHDPSACIDQARVDYLTELITPPPGTVCQADKQPFDPDFRDIGGRG